MHLGESVWITGNTLLYSIIFVVFTMFIIWFLPKLQNYCQSTLVAILFTTVLALTLKIDIPNVGDLASVKGGLPDFSIPSVPFNLKH